MSIFSSWLAAAEFGGHDVERGVGVRHDARVALADARRLDHDELEAGRLAGRDRVADRGRQLGAGIARREASA